MCYVLICYKNLEKRWAYQSQTVIVYWIRSSDQVDIGVVHYSCYNKLPQIRLKTTEVFFQFWRSEVQNRSVGRVIFSLNALERNPSLLLPASGSCQKSLVGLGCQLHHSNPCLHHHMAFSPWSLCLPSLSSKKTHQSFDLGSTLV